MDTDPSFLLLLPTLPPGTRTARCPGAPSVSLKQARRTLANALLKPACASSQAKR